MKFSRFKRIARAVLTGNLTEILNLSYSDVDECKIGNGGCPHVCINTPGEYICRCRSGYVTERNGTVCKISKLLYFLLERGGFAGLRYLSINFREVTILVYVLPFSICYKAF